MRVYDLFFKKFSTYTNINKFIYFPNFLQLLNDDSDKKKIKHPFYKLNVTLKKYSNFSNLNVFSKIFSANDVSNFYEIKEND